MEYTLTLDRDYGNRLQSVRDASVSNIPGASLVDLAGCGGTTHAYGQADISINALNNCAPLGLQLQMAYSGYSAWDNDATLFGGAMLSGGITINPTQTALSTYMLRVAREGLAWNYAGFAAEVLSITTANVATEQFGRSLLVKEQTTNRLIAQLSRPSVSDYFDNCNNVLGRRVKASMSIFGYDPATCKPGLIWQASLNLAVGTLLYPTGTAAVAITTHIFDVLAYEDIWTVASNANIQEAVETVWKSEQYNKSLLLGA